MLAFVMLIVVADIFGRVLFNHPIVGVADIVTILMPVFVFLPMAYTELFDGHIRVEVLTNNFNKKWSLLVDAFTSLCGVILLGILVWQGYEAAMESWRSETYHPGVLRIQLYPTLFAIVLGFALWQFQLLVAGILSIRNFIRNHRQKSE
ncbi:TRAP transporter small permease subunit [Thermodesulfobacteriota bacterium]